MADATAAMARGKQVFDVVSWESHGRLSILRRPQKRKAAKGFCRRVSGCCCLGLAYPAMLTFLHRRELMLFGRMRVPQNHLDAGVAQQAEPTPRLIKGPVVETVGTTDLLGVLLSVRLRLKSQ